LVLPPLLARWKLGIESPEREDKPTPLPLRLVGREVTPLALRLVGRGDVVNIELPLPLPLGERVFGIVLKLPLGDLGVVVTGLVIVLVLPLEVLGPVTGERLLVLPLGDLGPAVGVVLPLGDLDPNTGDGKLPLPLEDLVGGRPLLVLLLLLVRDVVLL